MLPSRSWKSGSLRSWSLVVGDLGWEFMPICGIRQGWHRASDSIIYLVDSACREGRWVHVPMSMRHAMLFGGENDETYEGLLDVICYE